MKGVSAYRETRAWPSHELSCQGGPGMRCALAQKQQPQRHLSQPLADVALWLGFSLRKGRKMEYQKHPRHLSKLEVRLACPHRPCSFLASSSGFGGTVQRDDFSSGGCYIGSRSSLTGKQSYCAERVFFSGICYYQSRTSLRGKQSYCAGRAFFSGVSYYQSRSSLRGKRSYCAETEAPQVQEEAEAGVSSREMSGQGSGAEREGAVNASGVLTEDERVSVISAWDKLLRWSRFSIGRDRQREALLQESIRKVTVFGGGSFGTAMAVLIARNKPDVSVQLLVRDANLAASICSEHCNTRYFADYKLPHNITATTDAAEALGESNIVIHAVPVQHSRAFLTGIRDLLPATTPLVSVSKGLEIGSGEMMSEVVNSALGREHPFACLSGPSFAVEMMQNRPTALVAASEEPELAALAQWLIASHNLRVNTSQDVVGVEIAGALKNVLAIAAGIVEGLDLGHNAMAALVSQGCSEIRWLGEKMGASPATLSGLSGVGDIMLTCFVNLSRNRTVGVRLGSGESIGDIMSTTSQVAEGVATAGAVVSLARKYHVSMPVLTAVARILDGQSTPRDAVLEVMKLPQIPEV